jgi:hypothetical protein
MAARDYTSRRVSITEAIVDTLLTINGTGNFRTTLTSVSPRLKFWDEVEEFPSVHVNAGPETRLYQGGGYKDRFLTVTVRCYVKQDNANLALEALLEDIETVLEENSSLSYLDSRGASQRTHQITIVSIDTDEGALEPLGVGEIQLEVRY